jgi:hypothetical protein
MSEPETNSPRTYESGFDKWVVMRFRPFAKAWFEFIRTLLVVSVFVYIGRKSNNFYIVLLSSFTYLLFFAYCYSFASLSLPIHSKAKYIPDRAIVNILIFLSVGYSIWTWSRVFPEIMEKLIDLQGQKPA